LSSFGVFPNLEIGSDEVSESGEDQIRGGEERVSEEESCFKERVRVSLASQVVTEHAKERVDGATFDIRNSGVPVPENDE